ncbi:MAG TPA: S9 family peptidase [Acidobacteriaceae bacterium]|nr:S9 family peptidase [Acidobacteriaceae bacterium]
MRLRTTWPVLGLSLSLLPLAGAQSNKPPITLDEYMSATGITAVRLAPGGSAAVIATEAPDWQHNAFSDDLWLWTAAGGLRPLTHSGSESRPQWSPDGKWVAFVSDRALPGEASGDDGAAQDESAKADRLWVISVAGGEALPLYTQKLDVHAFAWSPDEKFLYFSTTQPRTAEQQEAEKAEWKDVIRWREKDRGDVLVKLAVEPALARATTVQLPRTSVAAAKKAETKKQPAELPPGAQMLTTNQDEITEIAPSPDGKTIALETGPPNHREENPADYEIFFVSPDGGAARQATHNEALESRLAWSPDGRWLHFEVPAAAGSLEGKYRDVQGRLYRMDPETGHVERLGAQFTGSFDKYALLPDGRLLALGLKGTQTQLYRVDGDTATLLPGLPGTYADIDAAPGTGAIAVRYSTIDQPEQAFLVANPLEPDRLRKLTDFNPIFAQRAQPEWQTYTWKTDDGRTVEGVLLFPPGKKDAKHLRMLTLIHGGPADADGNRFGADWYDWATLAADRGWLVFRPNYRGSAGYGDDFMLAIEPHLVSAPGRDILAGVDALVRDGYADPDKLAIGGYSYGGYMTNWLITQTTRFKAAVTGAGAVEHAANWGNDDETYDDAWYLGGEPWQDPELYQSEAALFQFNKVKTPVHLVQGGADIRVSYLEGVTMERALQELGIPHEFLVFPGEGHGLGKNPWHGYIKVRDELQWLEKYVPE